MENVIGNLMSIFTSYFVMLYSSSDAWHIYDYINLMMDFIGFCRVLDLDFFLTEVMFECPKIKRSFTDSCSRWETFQLRLTCRKG